MHLESTQSTKTDVTVPRTFVTVMAGLFATSTVATWAWCSSMPPMGGMPMPGGWTMSMTWMPGPGQGWLGATLSFIGMWTVMMVAMMLPSLTPTLWRYRQDIGQAGRAHPEARTALMGLGYFLVWVVFGAATFPVVAALAAMAMRVQAMARMVPLAIAAIMLLAGLWQFSPWKAYGLACCRETPCTGSAWRDGVRHGVRCIRSCGGLTVAWVAIGVMDLHAMLLVTLAITAERLAPTRFPVSRLVGALVVTQGLLLLVRAAGLA